MRAVAIIAMVLAVWPSHQAVAAEAADQPSGVRAALDLLARRIAQVRPLPCAAGCWPRPGFKTVEIILKPEPTYIRGICEIVTLTAALREEEVQPGDLLTAQASYIGLTKRYERTPRFVLTRGEMIEQADVEQCGSLAPADKGVIAADPFSAWEGFKAWDLVQRVVAGSAPSLPITCRQPGGSNPTNSPNWCTERKAALKTIAALRLNAVERDSTEPGLTKIDLAPDVRNDLPYSLSVRVFMKGDNPLSLDVRFSGPLPSP
jgi:hypothetical protein